MRILEDGFKTLITFSLDATVEFEEIEVTPPGYEGGGEIDVSTMQNDVLRTRAPHALITLTPCQLVVAYNPVVYVTIRNMFNKNQLITVTEPDGDTIKFWGWIDEFTPGAHVEGERPTADLTIIPSNRNNSGVETDLVHTYATTTTAAP